MKNILILIIILGNFGCNYNVHPKSFSKEDFRVDLNNPTCETINEFGGFSKVYTGECSCVSDSGFFGTSWNFNCENEEDRLKIKHANYIGDMKKWNALIAFWEAREENQARELLRLTKLIISSSKDASKPFVYYINIKNANDYMKNNKPPDSLVKAFREFHDNVFIRI